MLSIEEMKAKLEKALSPKRYNHSIHVMETAVKLAGKYGADEGKAAIAGLLHDCARDIRGEGAIRMCEQFHIEADVICRRQPQLLHGPLGAHIAVREYGVEDPEIQHAIYCHTLGCENMSVLDKVVFLADYIEPGRDFEGVEDIRRKAVEDLDGAIILGVDRTIRYELKKGSLLHPDTVKTRNYLLVGKIDR